MGIDTDILSAGKVVAGVFVRAADANHIQKATTGAATMLAGINYFAYTALAAGSTVTGPPTAQVVPGQEVVIKDETGNANTNNITFAPASGTIDGSATKAVVATAYGSARVRFDGTNWFTV
jgi:hypothetical protein